MDPLVWCGPVLVVVGMLMAIFRKPVGVGFCKLGKAVWRCATFGLFDMASLYNEREAPQIMLLLGMCNIATGMILLVFAILFTAF